MNELVKAENKVIELENLINTKLTRIKRAGMDILIPLRYINEIENGYINNYREPPKVKSKRLEYDYLLRARQFHHLKEYLHKCFNEKRRR